MAGETVDLVALARELVQEYLAQGEQLAAASRVMSRWGAGAIDCEEAKAQLKTLGYDTDCEGWPCYFAGVLAVIADECLTQVPVEGRAVELARVLDAGGLQEVAAILRSACPGDSFIAGYEATVGREELANRLCDESLGT